jgi:twitching motility protein PilT
MAGMDKYLMMMVEHGASDLHFCTGRRPTFRKDGSIVRMREEEIDAETAKSLLFDIMPKHAQDIYNTAHETDFAYELAGFGRYRVNVYEDQKGVSGVFRLIPSKVLTFEELQLPKALKKFCTLSKGLVLVTGPTGSGKSTTLAAMIDYVNRTRAEHIITIEDPVEFVYQEQRCLINQREVGTNTMGFKSALRAALREDPDIVLVGEMRDLETTHIAIETAETGHLVFGTLHTTTAISTIDRLIDQFPPDHQQQIRTMLAVSLKGVIAQNLLKRKGGGRVAALEVLFVNHAVSALIRESKSAQIMSIMQTGRREGMTLLNQELVRLVKANVVELDEAWSKCVDKDNFLKTLEAAGISFSPLADDD